VLEIQVYSADDSSVVISKPEVKVSQGPSFLRVTQKDTKKIVASDT